MSVYTRYTGVQIASWHIHTVTASDTLYAIARRSNAAFDPQNVVLAIERKNHIQNATVYIGEKLWVPGR